MHSVAPGLLLTTAVACVCVPLSLVTGGLSPLMWAILIGIVLGNVLRVVPSAHAARLLSLCAPGVAVVKFWALRLGIILFGSKLTFQAIAGIGAAGLLADLYSIVSYLPCNSNPRLRSARLRA